MSDASKQDRKLKVITGIDWPMPDRFVDSRPVYADHGRWTGFVDNWKRDLRLLAEYGFDTLRFGVPWCITEPVPHKHNFELMDKVVNEAEKLGIELHYVAAHYNQPLYVKDRGEMHQSLARRYPESLANYCRILITRYGCKWVIPVVEIGTEARFRGGVNGQPALWAPQRPNLQDAVARRGIQAFQMAADAIHAEGAKVFCSEACDDFFIAKQLAPYVDALGLNYYTHFHGGADKLTLELQYWGELAMQHGVPFWVTEAGSHENHIPARFPPFTPTTVKQPYDAGYDKNRVMTAAVLEEGFLRTLKNGYPLELVSWYPGIPNMWRSNLTDHPGTVPTCDGEEDCTDWCDRAGLFDGITERVPCENLIKAVLSWKEISIPAVSAPEPAQIPANTILVPAMEKSRAAVM